MTEDSNDHGSERELAPSEIALERSPWCLLWWAPDADPDDPDIFGPFATAGRGRELGADL
jgi:hypothetical protein